MSDCLSQQHLVLSLTPPGARVVVHADGAPQASAGRPGAAGGGDAGREHHDGLHVRHHHDAHLRRHLHVQQPHRHLHLLHRLPGRHPLLHHRQHVGYVASPAHIPPSPRRLTVGRSADLARFVSSHSSLFGVLAALFHISKPLRQLFLSWLGIEHSRDQALIRARRRRGV